MRIDPIVKKILDELKFKPEDCLWEKHGDLYEASLH